MTNPYKSSPIFSLGLGDLIGTWTLTLAFFLSNVLFYVKQLQWFLFLAILPQLPPNQPASPYAWTGQCYWWYRLFISFLFCTLFRQQRWLARRSAQQLYPLIRCLAGRSRAAGMAVLAGSCPWREARRWNICWWGRSQDTAGSVWGRGYSLDPRELESEKERKGWVQSNPETSEQKEIGIRASWCFHGCYYVSSWTSRSAYTVLLYANVWAHPNFH